MSTRLCRVILAGWLCLAGLHTDLGGATPGLASEAIPTTTPAPTLDAPQRVIETVESGIASIGFIDSPSAMCYRPAANTGNCYIRWGTLSVSAGSDYVISMTVAINNRIVAHHSGFFQTSMTIPGTMHGPGFRVTCGAPIGDGSSGLGNSYAYTLRARASDGTTAANYGSVTCPADLARTYLPMLRK